MPHRRPPVSAQPILLVLGSLAFLPACAPTPVTRHEIRPKRDDTASTHHDSEDDSGGRETGGHTADTTETADSSDTGVDENFPARYPADRLQSPLTPFVRDRLAALAVAGSGLDAHVFMKVGDSITADPSALGCFAGDDINLGDREDLRPTLDFFLEGHAGSSTPFDRDSRAAEEGETADWALTGDPSPVEREFSALSPAFAVVQYGTNDMEMGSTHLSAIWSFGDAMLDLVDTLLGWSVVPLLLTIPPRLDESDADSWVPTYNALIRGIAQARQVPVADLELALRPLDGCGLASDGVHPEYDADGACRLNARGLEHGGNWRNLLVLDGLDRMRRAALDGETFDEPGLPLIGDGTAETPFEIDAFPFTDLRNTSTDGVRAIDAYPGCDSTADESGPELVYRVVLTEHTRLRALVFDRGDVDIDLHLLAESVSGEACVLRDDTDLEKGLDPGVWYFVLDTYVSSGDERAGEYLLVLLEV